MSRSVVVAVPSLMVSPTHPCGRSCRARLCAPHPGSYRSPLTMAPGAHKCAGQTSLLHGHEQMPVSTVRPFAGRTQQRPLPRSEQLQPQPRCLEGVQRVQQIRRLKAVLTSSAPLSTAGSRCAATSSPYPARSSTLPSARSPAAPDCSPPPPPRPAAPPRPAPRTPLGDRRPRHVEQRPVRRQPPVQPP